MATQTKADRSEAAKKAAATRERNQIRSESQDQGRKAAASRFANDARDNLGKARSEASRAVSTAGNVGKAAGGAAISVGRSVASRVGLGGRNKK